MKPVNISLSVGELAYVIGALNLEAEKTNDLGTAKVYQEILQRLQNHLHDALGADTPND